MNLRNKTLIVVGLSLLCLILILYATAQIELMISFANLENQNTEKDVNRALNAISNELTSLGDLANYWAARNDTYAFMSSGDPAFINYNTASGSLTNDSLFNMKINMIMFLDSYGQIVFSKYINSSGQIEAFPQNLAEQLSLSGFCPGCLDKKSKFKGIILLFDQPMLVVTQPITNSKRDRPSMGRVVLGRYLNQEEMRKLSETTQLNLTVYPLSDHQLPEDFRRIQPQLSSSSPVLVTELDEDKIAGYALLTNIYGNPLLILRVDASRDIYRQGTRSMIGFIFIFSLAGLLFLALTLFYLDRSVLSRLIDIASGIAIIGRTSNVSACLRVKGDDELAHLASSINEMLAALNSAHQDLIKSERRYKAVVEDQQDLICRYLSDGTITFVNDAFCTFFSQKAEDINGKRIDQSAFQGQMRSSEQLRGKISVAHPAVTYESQISLPECQRWILWTSRGIFDDHGSLLEIQSVGKDVTDLKIAEEALRDSEVRYRLLVDSAPVGIILHDGKRITYINKAGTRFLGSRDPDEIIGMPVLELVHPDFRQIVTERVRRALEDAQASPLIEEKFLRLDGSAIDVEVAALPFSSRQGEPAMQVIFHDITERKLAEEARRESEERYRLITENMNEVIFLSTPDPEIRYIYISPSIKQTGYNPSELIGKSPFEVFIIEPEYVEEVKQSYSELVRQKIPVMNEYRVQIRDGSWRWVETTANPILDPDGNIIYILGSTRDITPRKRAEEALKESQAQMADIISFLPDAILAIDLKGRVMIWNQAMEILTGVLAKDMLGKGDYEYSLPFYGHRRPILVDMILRPHEGFESEYLGFKREESAVVGEVFIPTFGPHGSYLLAKATALYDEFGNMVGAIESIRDMTERRQLEKTLERSRTELHVAAEIQKSFIPKNMPNIRNFTVAAITIPAMEVGGDFYDFISLPGGNYGLVIADVAGKSISAALYMALSRMIIRASVAHQSRASEVLRNANNMIALDAKAGMFVTLLYGVLDGDALTFNYADAGHPTPILFKSRDCRNIEEPATGIALGAKEGVAYEEREIKFDPGDVAVFYTDGVTEAMNSNGELYGLSRLTSTISMSCQSSAEEIMAKILKGIADFSENYEQNDDITILVLKACKNVEKHSEVTVAARNEEIPNITFLLDKIMSWAGFNRREILEVQLAVEEACNNIIRHGYRGSEDDIRVAVDFVAGGLKVTIEDDAPQFDPTHFDKPDFTADLEKRPVGGLGIHLIRSLVDEMKYELQDGKNRLILAKRVK